MMDTLCLVILVLFASPPMMFWYLYMGCVGIAVVYEWNARVARRRDFPWARLM